MVRIRSGGPGTSVQFKVLIQDQSVINEDRTLSAIHPMVVHTPVGFRDGPATARVAVVDVDASTGRLRAPAKLVLNAGTYRGVGEYRVRLPQRPGAATRPQLRGVTTPMTLAELESASGDEAFIKVSVFGTVLRTIGFVESPDLVGRRVSWAFQGDQLLIVPLAGTLDNAFYHRPSRSLQFYSFAAPGRNGLIHTALSQDIVCHETAHALIDGIAPDLYSATDPESLGIHEGVADLTAVLLSLRNRELPTNKSGDVLDQARVSSRHSRIAEEFGRARGQSQSLRDAFNQLMFGPASDPMAEIADRASPYSSASVLTGTLFAVLTKFLAEPFTRRPRGRLPGLREFPFRPAAFLATNRIGGMVYRGLDWLPPGEATFADLIGAMLAADRVANPTEERERGWLLDESVRRGITTSDALLPTTGRATELRVPIDVPIASVSAFVKRNREAFGVPANVKPTVALRPAGVIEPPRNLDEAMKDPVELDRAYRTKEPIARLLKVAWRERCRITLGSDFPGQCDVKRGTTIAVDNEGHVLSVLTSGRGAQPAGRQTFLQRLVDSGSLIPASESVTPGLGLRAAVVDGALRLDGALEALHVADAFVD